MKMDQKKLQEEALRALKSSALSSYKIAKNTGLTESSIGNYRNGRTKPTAPNATILLSYLKNESSKIVPESALQKNLSSIGIPLIPAEAMAGFGADNTKIMEYECERFVIPTFRDAEFLMAVKGSSMYPKYSNGDIVACKKLPPDAFFQWNKVYALDTEQGVLIKRIKKGGDDEHLLIVSENDRYDPFELHRSKVRAVAIVIGVIRVES
jgi:phage repressor protein C with HTH and peptisase S24 domain